MAATEKKPRMSGIKNSSSICNLKSQICNQAERGGFNGISKKYGASVSFICPTAAFGKKAFYFP